MKIRTSFLAAGLLSGLFLFPSCDKDNGNDNPPQKTKTELISQGSWKFKSATVNGSDASSMIQACQRDNIFTFMASGSGTVNEGATKCNASDPDNVPFTWSFTNAESILSVSATFFTGGENSFTLEVLTESTLRVSQYIASGPGPSFLVVITFQH